MKMPRIPQGAQVRKPERTFQYVRIFDDRKVKLYYMHELELL